jgi:hypothetical protein|tara:strand:- start:3332 stop:3691 length:360 start_codon:yes stop_codon:yes gene_type:complete
MKNKSENVNVRILYWKEIPLQVEVEVFGNKLSRQLEDRFQEGVDAIAMFENSYGSDDYLNGFLWGESFLVQGEINSVLEDKVNCFNKKFPKDFVSRIRDLQKQGKRKTMPGSADHWMEC